VERRPESGYIRGVSDQPKTLTESEVLGAIDSLALMVDSPGGDVEAKATLAMTTYRVAARTKGLAWADQRFASIFPRLRDQAREAGRPDGVERILRGIPEVQRRQRANEAAAHDVEALAVLVRGMAGVAPAPPTTEDLLTALVSTDAKQNPEDSRAECLERVALYLMGEVRRLRARVAELEPQLPAARCELCGRAATTTFKVALGQRGSPRCDEHSQ